jgi:hypothetical protein
LFVNFHCAVQLLLVGMSHEIWGLRAGWLPGC